MKVSFPEMSGPASARTPSHSATDGKDQPAFDTVLQDAEKPADARTSSRAEKQTSRAAQPQAHWQKFEAGLPQPGKEGEVAAALETDDSDKALSDREDDDHKAGRGKSRQPHDASQFDRLPLLMALHDLRRISETAAVSQPDEPTADAELSPATGDETPDGSQLKSEPSAPARLGLATMATSQPEPGPKTAAILAQGHPAGLAPAGATAHEEPGPQAMAELKGGGTGPGSVEARSPTGRQGQISEPVTVIREQSFAAPAPHPVSPTAAGLVSALAADNGLPQALAAASAPAQPALPVAQPTHMLKIELHPAELGTVTASLRLAGGQLSIELTPENQEAHRRLSSDVDAIIKSLRGLGFDVEKVSIMQPQIAVSATPRADPTGTATGSMGRDQSSFQPGNSGGNGDHPGGQQPGRNRNDDVQSSGRTASHTRDGAGSDLFI